MGIHDTVRFDPPRTCRSCGQAIDSVQLSSDGILEEFELGDCISHAEDLGVMREQLFCRACNGSGQHVYLVVFRGILVGIGDSFAEAKQLLDGMSPEKILFLYHDLFKKYRFEQRHKRGLEGFLEDLVKWFTAPDKQRLFYRINDAYFKDAADAVDAIKRYLEDKEALEHDDREGSLF
jgi:hypothetical protein